MRVGIHADPIYHRIPAGIGRYAKRLLENLPTPGGDEYLPILSSSSNPKSNEPCIRSPLPLRALYPSWNYFDLPKIKAPLDVVHATTNVIPAHRSAALVATIHDLTLDRIPSKAPSPWVACYRRGLRRAIHEARIICTPTSSVRDELVQSYGVSVDRVFVTPYAPGVVPGHANDDSVFEALGIDGPFVLAVGTIEPRKNYATLIEAFRQASPGLEGHRLVIAGAPGWGADGVFEAAAATEGVVMTGSISTPRLVSLYERATAFCQASIYEGFGLPLAEALAFGVPSASSTDPNLVEVGRDAAVFVDAGDAGAWAKALDDLIHDEALRTRLRESALIRAGELTWSNTAASTVKAYEAAVSP